MIERTQRKQRFKVTLNGETKEYDDFDSLPEEAKSIFQSFGRHNNEEQGRPLQIASSAGENKNSSIADKLPSLLMKLIDLIYGISMAILVLAVIIFVPLLIYMRDYYFPWSSVASWIINAIIFIYISVITIIIIAKIKAQIGKRQEGEKYEKVRKVLTDMERGSIFGITSIVSSVGAVALILIAGMSFFTLAASWNISPLVFIGLGLVFFPLLRRCLLNFIVYKKVFVKNKTSRPTMAPLVSLPFAFYGFMFLITGTLQALDVTIEEGDYFSAVVLYLGAAALSVFYFFLMRKLTIDRSDL